MEMQSGDMKMQLEGWRHGDVGVRVERHRYMGCGEGGEVESTKSLRLCLDEVRGKFINERRREEK